MYRNLTPAEVVALRKDQSDSIDYGNHLDEMKARGEDPYAELRACGLIGPDVGRPKKQAD